MSKLQLKPAETCEGKTRFPISECPNMKMDPKDQSMETERYVCAVCGKSAYLDYDEMR